MTNVVQIGTDGQAGPKHSLDRIAAIFLAAAVITMTSFGATAGTLADNGQVQVAATVESQG